jgi:hypothetical protein
MPQPICCGTTGEIQPPSIGNASGQREAVAAKAGLYPPLVTDAAANYARDFGDLLWQLASEAQSQAATDDHARGRAFGLYEAASLMEQQALAFGLPREAVGPGNRQADTLLGNG